MSPARVAGAVILIAALASGSYAARHGRPAAPDGDVTTSVDSSGCAASASSLTPPRWHSSPAVASHRPSSRLRTIGTIPLPGPSVRYDYQSIDPVSRRLYISHMNAGTVTVFDLDSSKVIADVEGMRRATGVLAVPREHRIFVSAAGSHELIAIDDRSHEVRGRVAGMRFPDGIAYAPLQRRIFVSDEAGKADVAIDAATMVKLATIDLGGEAGNTHYDSVSRCVIVAVQTRNQLAAIDPATNRVTARYDLPGSDEPHGFTIDEAARLAFVTGEGNATLQVIDLRTMRVLSSHKVGEDPDVIVLDPTWRALYVASEGGTLSVFEAVGSGLTLIDEVRIPHAHTVSVDPQTHRVYLPLENVGGRPVLQIMSL